MQKKGNYRYKIEDFQCVHENSAGIKAEAAKQANLRFPDVYKHWDLMAELALAMKSCSGMPFVELPFCHTVEGEAMGGIVNYGDDRNGPRAGAYICTRPEELLELPEIDCSKGRIHEVLLACRDLRKRGEQVVLDVSGPFTILNVLIDSRYVFKAMRKQPELMKEVFRKLGQEILKYMLEIEKSGVRMISYADPTGGVNILGPDMAARVVENFTYDFLKDVDRKLKQDTLILLCPKTALALIGMGWAEFIDIHMSRAVCYGEACMEMIGKTRFAGQTCVRNTEYQRKNVVFKAVKLRNRTEIT